MEFVNNELKTVGSEVLTPEHSFASDVKIYYNRKPMSGVQSVTDLGDDGYRIDSVQKIPKSQIKILINCTLEVIPDVVTMLYDDFDSIVEKADWIRETTGDENIRKLASDLVSKLLESGK